MRFEKLEHLKMELWVWHGVYFLLSKPFPLWDLYGCEVSEYKPCNEETTGLHSDISRILFIQIYS
jgi:hypothetical protein